MPEPTQLKHHNLNYPLVADISCLFTVLGPEEGSDWDVFLPIVVCLFTYLPSYNYLPMYMQMIRNKLYVFMFFCLVLLSLYMQRVTKQKPKI